jgi:hypothetical protein
MPLAVGLMRSEKEKETRPPKQLEDVLLWRIRAAVVENPARRSKLRAVLCKAAMILGPLSAWTVLLSSPNVTSLKQWKQFSMAQCPCFSLSTRSGMALRAGRLVTP